MLNSFYAPSGTTIVSVGSMAAVIGLVLFLISAASPVKAEPQEQTALHQAYAKGDRLPLRVTGTACSALGWPHYEQSCQFDLRQPAGEARTVRIIAVR